MGFKISGGTIFKLGQPNKRQRRKENNTAEIVRGEGNMSHRIKKVQYLEGYSLKLLFDDGKNKVVDLADIVRRGKNLIAQLKDIEYFKKVKCDGFSVVWPNGIDLCPDSLYKKGKDVPAEKKKTVQTRARKNTRKSRPRATR